MLHAKKDLAKVIKAFQDEIPDKITVDVITKNMIYLYL